jgi:hypothetical protein
VSIDWKKEIKLSDLRLPSFSRPRRGSERSATRSSLKGKTPSKPKALSSGPSVQLPKPLTDLYEDLRDRHLLPLVALLIVAIIAAPILLNKSSEKEQPPIVTGSAPAVGEAGESSFTVVPAARSLRSPGKRLAHRRALNPFRAPAHGPTVVEGGDANVTSSGDEAAAGSNTGDSASPSTPVTHESIHIEKSVESAPVEVPSAPSVAPIVPESTGEAPIEHSEKPTSTTTEEVVVNNTVGYTVTLGTGVVPEALVEQTEVQPMTKLPTAKEPLILFVGLSQDDKRALFLMTSKVTGYYGALHCTVDKAACQMVELKVGGSGSFGYIDGEGEARYKVQLKAIEPVVETDEEGSKKTVKTTKRVESKPGASQVGQARRFSK